jgi:transposase InsO family protein
MSRKGNCWDNTLAESFFNTIKVEWIYRHNFTNQEQAQLSIFEWIESWYNRRRRHSALGYQIIEEPKRSGARRNQFERNNYKFKNAA